MIEQGKSSIEKLLGIRFESSPKHSRYPLPVPPEGHPRGTPYTQNNFVVTREAARDWLTYRVIRREFTSKDVLKNTPDFQDNRKFIIPYVRQWAKVFRGEWDEPYNPNTHEGAAFSPNGFLLDAQHRLAGFLLSDEKFFEISVTRDVDWKAFVVMNKGKRRNVSQMLGDDIPYAQQSTGIARHLIPILDGTEREMFTCTGRDADVRDIVRGWPYFQIDSEWSKDIAATQRSRIPMGPLGASVMGALAAGAPPFEVKAFVDGLMPGYRGGYPDIGVGGEDPRRLLKLAFLGTGKRRYSDAEQRVNAGMIRKAMEVWLHRNDEKPKILKALPRTPALRSLPEVWGSEKVRLFHSEHVS
ncbi:hypothetical protein ABT282_07095 [Streptomyces sp. NPDC000927]|uniref:hypothetical protein n=1 Tax=Streptomyces sp. NPDC000927 TaxID=3154371 RepID=UPI00332FE121